MEENDNNNNQPDSDVMVNENAKDTEIIEKDREIRIKEEGEQGIENNHENELSENLGEQNNNYEWNVVLDCAVYPMVYRMERIEEESSQQHSQQQHTMSQQVTSGSPNIQHIQMKEAGLQQQQVRKFFPLIKFNLSLLERVKKWVNIHLGSNICMGEQLHSLN